MLKKGKCMLKNEDKNGPGHPGDGDEDGAEVT